jgi:hypothetical protein
MKTAPISLTVGRWEPSSDLRLSRSSAPAHGVAAHAHTHVERQHRAIFAGNHCCQYQRTGPQSSIRPRMASLLHTVHLVILGSLPLHYLSLLCNHEHMERTTRQFTISLPPEMAEQVTATAKAESRTISELFREAFRTYRASRVRTLLDASQQEGRRMGHTGHRPEDVGRLIHETRKEETRKRRTR